MLMNPHSTPDHPSLSPYRAEPSTLSAVVALCRSYRWLITGWIAICMALAIAAIYSIKPQYLARAELVLDARLQNSASNQGAPGVLTVTDPTPIIRSEVQLLQSPSLASDVVSALKLNTSPEF